LGHLLQPHERRVADGLRDVRIDFHDGPLMFPALARGKIRRKPG
jgi:hypothetical protein